MAEIAEIWSQALPTIKQGVTGVGVWAALNSAKPIAVEEGQLVLGLAPGETELAGHLKIPLTKKLIEQELSQRIGSDVKLRVIDGTSYADWERIKRRDVEAKRLQEVAHNRVRAELESRTSWDTVYEQLGRKFAATPNKSMPQNRARFYQEGVQLIVETRKALTVRDELNERNFARVLERLAQYSEIPSAVVAVEVLRKAGELDG